MIRGPKRLLKLQFCALEFFLDLRFALDRRLLGLQQLDEISVLGFEFVDLCFKITEPLFRSLVRFLFERFALDLELDQSPLEAIHFLGLRFNFHAYSRCGFVDKIDRLVRQVTIANVPM